MNVHARNRHFYRAQNVAIVEGRQAMRQTSLNAHFRGAELPGLDCLFGYPIWLQEISVGFARSAAERTKLAPYETNISEINIPIHDVANDIPSQFTSKRIGRYQQSEQVVAVSVTQCQALFAREYSAVLGLKYAVQRF